MFNYVRKEVIMDVLLMYVFERPTEQCMITRLVNAHAMLLL